MIGWLDGIVRLRDPLSGTVILDVGGVGYQLTVSWQTFARVPEVGQRTSLWVHTHAREDVLALYGFGTPEEKQMYMLLTSVPQIGPRNAIGVLGGLPLPELLDAIASGDQATLERIPGVGKRTAERILVDLRDKVERLRGQGEPSPVPVAGPGRANVEHLRDEARAVLVNLGWKLKPVDTVLAKLDASDVDLDALVRRALAQLMARP